MRAAVGERGRDGYFPRDRSMLRRVHEERAVGLLYGQRALAIGAVAPLNYVGTRLHTRALDKPFQRLVKTAKAFETVYFGSREEADRVLELVHRLHEDVEGKLPEDAGPIPAGTPYSAFDPELMLWTVAVIADSAQVFYELFVRRLSEDERDALWADYVRFGELFGMPPEVAPDSHAEFRDYYEGRLASNEAYLTDEARYVGSAILFHIPVPAPQAPAMQVHNLFMRGALPPRVRALYGLRWSPAHALAFRGAVRAVRGSLALAPRGVRSGWNTKFFEDVAKTERARIARGRPVKGALA